MEPSPNYVPWSIFQWAIGILTGGLVILAEMTRRVLATNPVVLAVLTAHIQEDDKRAVAWDKRMEEEHRDNKAAIEQFLAELRLIRGSIERAVERRDSLP
jgi:hypothetical protein